MSILIGVPDRNVYSETFIRAHINRLPTDVFVLYGGHPPRIKGDGQPLQSSAFHQRAVRRTIRTLSRKSSRHLLNQAISDYICANKISAVLAEYGQTGAEMLDACRLAEVPLIVHFHGVDAYSGSVLSEYTARYHEMFRQVDAMIAVSRAMEEQLISLGAPREKLRYNPYGVDVDQFQGAQPAQAPPHFVAVGRFVYKKGPHETLLAFGRVLEECPEARLTMIGDGYLWQGCKQLAHALRLSNAVEFLGPLSHTEVAEIMRSVRGLVQHSTRAQDGDSEGTPVAILEAGASGLPVVATRHAGIKDVVVHDQTGFLVDEGDIDAMAQGMIRLVREPELADRLGKSARRRICSRFTMAQSIQNLWAILSEVISGSYPALTPPRRRCAMSSVGHQDTGGAMASSHS